MKKILILFFAFSFLLTSCQNSGFFSSKNNSSDSTSKEETNGVSPFVFVNEETATEEVDRIDWKKIINLIPSDAYIQIDGFHTTPISATLYKNGDYFNLNVKDPRLIRLLNFYNNEVYCGICSYSQGTANELYEIEKECDFRLELTFEKGTSLENCFDKMVVIDDCFYCIQSNVPFENYSYSSFGKIPLHDVGNLNWLSVFGF